MPSQNRLRTVVATPLREELCALIESLEPRIELVCEQALLPPMRFAADYSGDPSFSRTREQQQRFEDLLATADAFYGIPDVNPQLLKRTVESNPTLRWVQTMAAGGGGQVRDAGLSADDLERVIFTTSAGVHGEALAEFALFGLLAGAKTLPRLVRQQRNHEWSGRWTMGQLRDQTVLVLGLGGIGSAVAKLLDALGAHVLGMSRHNVPVDGVAELIHPRALADAVASVDGIVNTLPGTAETENLVDARFLSAVKSGTSFVNVGRGTTVDLAALIAALNDGRIGFAALDVFAIEPLDAASPLWDMENVLISPHTAALTGGEEEKIARLFARNAGALLDGRGLRNVVDTVHFY